MTVLKTEIATMTVQWSWSPDIKSCQSCTSVQLDRNIDGAWESPTTVCLLGNLHFTTRNTFFMTLSSWQHFMAMTCKQLHNLIYTFVFAVPIVRIDTMKCKLSKGHTVYLALFEICPCLSCILICAVVWPYSSPIHPPTPYCEMSSKYIGINMYTVEVTE